MFLSHIDATEAVKDQINRYVKEGGTIVPAFLVKKERWSVWHRLPIITRR